MHGCSCKKLTVLLLLSLVLAGCATTGGRGKSEASLPGFIPGGCSTYLAGRVDALPAMFADMFTKNGIPDQVIKDTDRIYCCFVTPDKLTVFLEGDYNYLNNKSLSEIYAVYKDELKTDLGKHQKRCQSGPF